MPYQPPDDPRTARTGRVLRVDRGQCDALYDGDVVRASWRFAELDDGPPCVGDSVELAEIGEQLTVTAILPRRSAITRIDAAPGSSEHQVLAANVDVAVICEPCHPNPPLRPRRAVAGPGMGSRGARPAVVLTEVRPGR